MLLVEVRRRWAGRLAAAAACVALVVAAGCCLGLPSQGGPEVLTLLYADPPVRGVELLPGMATWVLRDRHLRGRPHGDVAWTAIEGALARAPLAWFARGFPWVAGQWTSAAVAIAFGYAGSCWAFAAAIAVFASSRGAMPARRRARSRCSPAARASRSTCCIRCSSSRSRHGYPGDTVSPAPVLPPLVPPARFFRSSGRSRGCSRRVLGRGRQGASCKPGRMEG
ncbi:MAG: hypothetical protein O9972_51060 [Burkholderiales bacterium]|nr:hypothetical protein [Burkholderiales bacterium]MCZ8106209.1 hypothetical protein [Burkholderiales bacterium]